MLRLLGKERGGTALNAGFGPFDPDREGLENWVPHRPPLLLLSGIREVKAESCLAWLKTDPEAWYALPDGSVPGWFGIELMAQTIAAFSGHAKARAGLPPRLGFLLGTQSYESTVSAFPAYSILEIQADLCFQDASGLYAFECAIRLERCVVARSVLKVFEKQ